MGVISGRYGISAAHSGQSNYIGHKIRLREGGSWKICLWRRGEGRGGGPIELRAVGVVRVWGGAITGWS